MELVKLEEFQPSSEVNDFCQICQWRRYYKVGLGQAMCSSQVRKRLGHFLAATQYSKDQKVDSNSELSQPSDKREILFPSFCKRTALGVHSGLSLHIYIPVVE